MSDLYQYFQTVDLNIIVAACLDVEKEWRSMVESFKYVRIYYVRSGGAKLKLTDGEIDLEEGYLYFIPAYSVIGGNCKDHMEHYFIHIIPDMLTEHYLRMLPLKNKCKMDKATADFLFRTIANNYKKTSFASRFTTESALKLILSHFFGDFKIEDLSESGRFMKIFEYIDSHIDERIYIKDLSDLVYMDDAYCSNLFKHTFGISMKKYVQQKRTDRAKELLASDLTIAEIANKMNFFDAASFSNFFKKQTGVSAKDFRKQLLSPPLKY